MIYDTLAELCGEMYASFSPIYGLNLINLISRCNIYPCSRLTAGPRDCVQCFVEFVDHASVQRALNLRREDWRVYAMFPNFIEEYRSAKNTASLSQEARHGQTLVSSISSLRPSVPLADKTARRSSPASKTSLLSPRKRIKSNRSTPISRPRTRDTDPLAQLFSYGTSFIDTLKASVSEPSSNSQTFGRHDKENDSTKYLSPAITNISQLQNPISVSRPFTSPISARTVPNDSNPDDRIKIISGPSFTLETRLIMKLCGEYISYDLDSLENNPAVIIKLLQASASERDKWMTVACHYRRNDNLGAAIEVVTSMLDGKHNHSIAIRFTRSNPICIESHEDKRHIGQGFKASFSDAL